MAVAEANHRVDFRRDVAWRGPVIDSLELATEDTEVTEGTDLSLVIRHLKLVISEMANKK